MHDPGATTGPPPREASRPGSPPATGGEPLPPPALLLFAPVHKRAFGSAIGMVAGLSLFVVTAALLLLAPGEETMLILLAQYFLGYSISWTGALIGSAWAAAVGFVAGWFLAFSRNLVIAIWIFLVRSREDLRLAHSFLDHI